MTAWTAFTVVTGIVLALVLVLSRVSASAIDDLSSRDADGAVDRDASVRTDDRVPPDGDRPEPDTTDVPELTTTALLANVAFSQGLFGVLLVVAIWLASVPPDAIGLSDGAFDVAALALAVVAGVVLYVLNEFGSAHARRWGVTDVDRLRRLLAPDSLGGWILLFVVVLPVIAGFEELLFRGILIGAFSVGFDLSPWVLAIGSSIAFGLGHGAQGRVGVAVTGGLGLALAWLFIVTESLIAVIVAHYIVNALEFLLHEGFDVGWGS